MHSDPLVRRGFLKALLLSAGGVAVAVLPGCRAEASPDARAWTGAVEGESVPVRVQPGLRYANTLPSRVPAVRRLSAQAATVAAAP